MMVSKRKYSAVFGRAGSFKEATTALGTGHQGYFCRGPVHKSGTCHLQNVPLDHLFRLILRVSDCWRGKGRCGVINADFGAFA